MNLEDLHKISILTERIDNLIQRLDRFEEKMVTQHEFWPVKTLVYGGVATALVTILGALIALVLRH